MDKALSYVTVANEYKHTVIFFYFILLYLIDIWTFALKNS